MFPGPYAYARSFVARNACVSRLRRRFSPRICAASPLVRDDELPELYAAAMASARSSSSPFAAWAAAVSGRWQMTVVPAPGEDFIIT